LRLFGLVGEFFDRFVTLVGTHLNSPQVHREIERALNRNRLIIPMRVQDIAPTGAMEFLLSTCQWIDAYDPHFGAALTALTDRVKNVLAAR
jgi:hypothetical protein